jgi:hypothetical protein
VDAAGDRVIPQWRKKNLRPDWGMRGAATASGEGPALWPDADPRTLPMLRSAAFLIRCAPIFAALSLAACATTYTPPAEDPASLTPSSSQAAG